MTRKTASRDRDPEAEPQGRLTAPPGAADRIAALDPGDLTEAERCSLLDLALRVLAERHRRGRMLGSPEDTRAYLRLGLAEYKNEVFGCLFLDNRHRILGLEELFQGTVDGASVHPRVVVQRALALNAGAVVLFHNHPSGVAEPSRADELLTRRLKDALALVDVRVLDHFVVTAEESTSFAERGLL
jgi:DNA repair protein RadC